MNQPAPARKIDVLLQRLKLLADGNAQQPLDELESHRLRQQAKTLLKTDPAEAHMVLGLLALLQWDETVAEQEFKAAFTYGWNPVLAINYSVMLSRFNRVEEALRQVEEIISAGAGGPHYAAALYEAIKWAYSSGRLYLAANYVRLCQLADAPLSGDVALIASQLESLITAADALALSDDLMSAMQAPAWTLLRQQGFRKPIAISDTVLNDGDLFMTRTFLLPVSSEDAYRLDHQLIETVSEMEVDWPVERFGVALREEVAA